MWVQRRYAVYDQIESGSLDHFSDSYCLVRSRMRVRTATLACVAAGEESRAVMSIARNIRDRKVGKSSRRRVGRCLGLIEIAPVVGSITMFCRPESLEEMIIPLVEPGAAM